MAAPEAVKTNKSEEVKATTTLPETALLAEEKKPAPTFIPESPAVLPSLPIATVPVLPAIPKQQPDNMPDLDRLTNKLVEIAKARWLYSAQKKDAAANTAAWLQLKVQMPELARWFADYHQARLYKPAQRNIFAEGNQANLSAALQRYLSQVVTSQSAQLLQLQNGLKQGLDFMCVTIQHIWMLRLGTVILCLCMCSWIGVALAEQPVTIDALSLPTLDQPSILLFYSHDCAPCRQEMAMLPALVKAVQEWQFSIIELSAADPVMAAKAKELNVSVYNRATDGVKLITCWASFRGRSERGLLD